MILASSDKSKTFVSAANFSRESLTTKIDLAQVKELSTTKLGGKQAVDCFNETSKSGIDDSGKLKLELAPWSAKLFYIEAQSERDRN